MGSFLATLVSNMILLAFGQVVIVAAQVIGNDGKSVNKVDIKNYLILD